MKILVTGGAGYIGSHTVIQLLNQGYEVVVADNFSNSKHAVLERVQEITGKQVKLYTCDLCDAALVKEIFASEKIEAVIHFAGLKSVAESVQKPLEYYENNLVSTLNVLSTMQEVGVKNFVFSSSATVYGAPETVPIREDARLSTTNPYGTTKLMIERIIEDYCHADKDFNGVILRYFNPIGAHKSGRIGEDPNGIPNNLVPYVAQVAVGRLEKINVTGDDYDTPDGTGVRDYIHVLDLADGHIAALKLFDQDKPCGLRVYNLGTGKGYSVLDVVKAFSEAVGRALPYKFAPRRPGDIAQCYADVTKAEQELGWKTKYSIDEMCEDSWRWQKQNPNGYD